MSAPLQHLIAVCCHATFRGGSPYDEDSWILQSFQKSHPEEGKPGEHLTFIQHIKAGLELHRQDPQSHLVFSGGKTQNSIDTTEAESYIKAVEALELSSPDQLSSARYTAETRATDSYQNLLFSILHFEKVANYYPQRITVVTHAFKERRFLELHAKALKFDGRIQVLGINPPFSNHDLEVTETREKLYGYDPFAKDHYGVGEYLAGKRKQRNWDDALIEELEEGHEPSIGMLLRWRGGADGVTVFRSLLPWES